MSKNSTVCLLIIAATTLLPGLLPAQEPSTGTDAQVQPLVPLPPSPPPGRDGPAAARRRHFQGERHPGGPGKLGDMPFLERFREENPAEFERLKELRLQDPDKFREEIRQRLQQRFQERGAGRELPEEERQLREAVRRWHGQNPAAAPEKRRQELRQAVETCFDADLQRRLERLEEMEKKLAGLRTMLETRRAARDKICEERLENLTTKPAGETEDRTPEMPALPPGRHMD